MNKPLGMVFFHKQSCCKGMNVMTLKRVFCPWLLCLFPECWENKGMSWPVVSACCFTVEPTPGGGGTRYISGWGGAARPLIP